MAYQSVAYRVQTYGESPEEAAAQVEAYLRASIGLEVRVTASGVAA